MYIYFNVRRQDKKPHFDSYFDLRWCCYLYIYLLRPYSILDSWLPHIYIWNATANRLHFHFPSFLLECLLLSSVKTKAFFPCTVGMPVNELQPNYLNWHKVIGGGGGKKWDILFWLPDPGPNTYFSTVKNSYLHMLFSDLMILDPVVNCGILELAKDLRTSVILFCKKVFSEFQTTKLQTRFLNTTYIT